MLKSLMTIFSLYFLFLSCITNNERKNKEQKKDTIFVGNANRALRIVPCDKIFKSTIDTNILDTLYFGEYQILIESLSDSIYNDLYCRYKKKTKTFLNPYSNRQYQEFSQIEAKLINEYPIFVTRHPDTLILKLGKDSLELLNTYNREVNVSYFYICYLKFMKSHLVYTIADGDEIIIVPYMTGKELYLGSNIYSSDSLGQMIFSDFSEDVESGGWFDKFSIVESGLDSTLKKVVTLNFPRDSRNEYKTWGVKDPFWLSRNNIVFSYCVGRMNEKGYYYDYFFANMRINKKSAANTQYSQ
jgi:hypothetical protein